MKIFQIGFNKCGTGNLYKLFKESGYNSVHWYKGKLAKTIKFNYDNNIKILDGIDNFIFYSDMDSSIDDFPIEGYKYFKEIDKQYPGSKFILNIRPVEKWINSRIKHNPYGKNTTRTYGGQFKDHYKLGSIEEVKEFWRKDWEHHINDVLNYFKDRPDDLIVFNIETDYIDVLVNFFNKYNINLDKKIWVHKFLQ
jgi:hypothetical protein